MTRKYSAGMAAEGQRRSRTSSGRSALSTSLCPKHRLPVITTALRRITVRGHHIHVPVCNEDLLSMTHLLREWVVCSRDSIIRPSASLHLFMMARLSV